jgi:hypothetical protein
MIPHFTLSNWRTLEKSTTPDTDYLQISAESYQNYEKTIPCVNCRFGR